MSAKLWFRIVRSIYKVEVLTYLARELLISSPHSYILQVLKMPQRISVSGEWECGLAEIQHPRT